MTYDELFMCVKRLLTNRLHGKAAELELANIVKWLKAIFAMQVDTCDKSTKFAASFSYTFNFTYFIGSISS